MNIRPSPVIPLLLVGVIGLLISGPEIRKGSYALPEMEDIHTFATISLFIIIPIVLILIVNFVTEMILIPLLFLLVVLLLGNLLICPLVLLVVIHFLGKYYHSSSSSSTTTTTALQQKRYNSVKYEEEVKSSSSEDQKGLGFGCFMILLLFLILYGLFNKRDEGYRWVSLILVLSFILFFNM
ncbi:hypothetical protein IHE45_11G034000, partial [Dioscorea alata]